MRFSVILNSCDNFFFNSSFNFFRNLSYVVFLWSWNIQVLRHIAPRMFLRTFLFNAAIFLLFLRVAPFYGKVIVGEKYLIVFLKRNQIVVLQSCNSGSINSGEYHHYYRVIKKFLKALNLYFHFSYLYLFLAGNIIVYTPSQGTNREKYFTNYYIKVKMLTRAGNKQPFHPSLFS